MTFWARKATTKPVQYAPPPDYLLTVRMAALEPGSGPCHLYVETENFDDSTVVALLGTLRPHTVEQLKLDLTMGFGSQVAFHVKPVDGGKDAKDGKEGKPRACAVSLTGFIHPMSAIQAGDDEEEGEDGSELEVSASGLEGFGCFERGEHCFKLS